MITRLISVGLALGLAYSARGFPAEEKPAEVKPGSLRLVDANGKEQKISHFRFTTGIRRLGWLAPEKGPSDKSIPKGKRPAAPAAGPEALVVRDDAKINFLEGVVTLVPLTNLRSIRFDGDKQQMVVVAATGGKPGEDVTLTGSTKYKGINKITLEAEVDKGDAGVATLTYQGGTLRGGIRGLQFPSPKVEPFKPGRPAVVVSLDDDVRKSHKISDLQALYRLPSGGEKQSSMIMFKKTLKLDLAKIKTVHVSAEKDADAVWQVVTKEGDDSTLTPLGTLPIDGQSATLVGLVGRVPVGFKLFPLRRIKAIAFDTSEEPKEKDADKEKEKPKDD